jgi:hypothetical protein
LIPIFAIFLRTVDDLVGHLDALGAGADELAAREEEERGLRLLEPVDEAGELLRDVLSILQGHRYLLQVQRDTGRRRCHDILHLDLHEGSSERHIACGRVLQP